jgi:hypothetical protein
LTKQADNRMHETPASVKATMLKAGYVLAPILLLVLNLYVEVTDYIPAGYYDDDIVSWIFIILAVQIVVLIWVRKTLALLSLMMSILVSIVLPSIDNAVDLEYLGFTMANRPLEQYRDKCVTVPYFDGRAETLAYCQTLYEAGSLQHDIMMDTGGWLIADAAKRPRAWREAFSTLITTATHSALFQVAALKDVNENLLQVFKMGHGFFIVSYPADEDD